jgi:hypothetical protein
LGNIAHIREKINNKIIVENHMGRGCLMVMAIDGRIILKCILRKYGGGCK